MLTRVIGYPNNPRGYLGTIDDEITCLGRYHHQLGGPLSVLQVLNLDYGVSVFGGIGYEGSLSRIKVQGNFLLLCSSTNFVSYSDVGRRYSAGFSSTESSVCKLSLNIQSYLLR